MNPAELDLSVLPRVAVARRRDLPDEPGLYFVLDPAGEVLYIGLATSSLMQRWRAHHRQAQAQAIPDAAVAYLVMHEPALLPDIEQALIIHFRPRWNRTAIPSTGQRPVSVTVRLDESTIEAVDTAITAFYDQPGVARPSRQAQLERWVQEGLERMQRAITDRATP